MSRARNNARGGVLGRAVAYRHGRGCDDEDLALGGEGDVRIGNAVEAGILGSADAVAGQVSHSVHAGEQGDMVVEGRVDVGEDAQTGSVGLLHDRLDQRGIDALGELRIFFRRLFEVG